jgi:Uma2 family endonuclease
MPVALTIALEPQIPLSPPRKRWTRTECAALEASGIWEAQKLELIDGELISKMGKNRPHVRALVRMMKLLVEVFGWDRVNPEAPIEVASRDNPTNEPEPDLIVLRQISSFPTTAPKPTDLDLVVEIADTTLRFDLTVKAELYARAGIVEYWVLDLTGRRLIVHREPQAGSYRSIIAYSESEMVAPLASPQNELLVTDLFES